MVATYAAMASSRKAKRVSVPAQEGANKMLTDLFRAGGAAAEGAAAAT